MADPGKGGGGGMSTPVTPLEWLVHVHTYFMYGSMQAGKYGNLYRPTMA